MFKAPGIQLSKCLWSVVSRQRSQLVSAVSCGRLPARCIFSRPCRQPIRASCSGSECLLQSTIIRRYKRTKKQDDDDSDEDLETDDSSQLIKFRTSTMRMDTVLKHALGKSRNKIEVAFYESRIRVNEQKVSKKSHSVEVGDEIDLIKGPSPNNPDFLLVSRVEVLSAELDGEELEVKLKRFKNLLINNYDNKWKPST